MEYKSLQENPTTILQLVKPEVTKNYFEVVADNTRYASIDLLHAEGTLARLESVDGSFTMKRMGFFIPYVTLRKENELADVAISWLNLSSKTTITLDGCNYGFRHYDLWKNQWAWFNEKNRPIVKYKLVVEGPLRGQIEVSSDAMYSSALELLISIGAFFLLQLNDELSRQNDKK